jgi:hypothetical protein
MLLTTAPFEKTALSELRMSGYQEEDGQCEIEPLAGSFSRGFYFRIQNRAGLLSISACIVTCR